MATRINTTKENNHRSSSSSAAAGRRRTAATTRAPPATTTTTSATTNKRNKQQQQQRRGGSCSCCFVVFFVLVFLFVVVRPISSMVRQVLLVPIDDAAAVLTVSQQQQQQQQQQVRQRIPPSGSSSINNINNNTTLNTNRLKYTGSFGLGHRLSKLTAAYHLAVHALQLPLLEVDWGRCGSDATNNSDSDSGVDIFAHLFGTNELVITTTTTTSATKNHQQQQPPQANNNKVIWVRNDVHGYYAGQSYKNFEIPLTAAILDAWRAKLASDAVLLAELADRFWHQQQHAAAAVVEQQQQRWQWKQHTVIGLHVRAGNGEGDHFTEAGRNRWSNGGENNSTKAKTLQRLIHRLVQYLQQQQASFKPPLVFLATDTASWIDIVRDALKPIPVVVWEQPRVPLGQGVSYQAWANKNNNNNNNNNNEQCLQGWSAAATDMFLLASVDVLIAATRSTFTQIAPAALVFSNSHSALKFCEMDGPRLTCFKDQWTWLLRRKQPQATATTPSMVTFSVNSDDEDTTAVQVDENDDGSGNNNLAVTHKVMVHLPDVNVNGEKNERDDPIRTAALAFLADVNDNNNENNNHVFYYGRKYNPKYRDKKRPFRTDWVWAED